MSAPLNSPGIHCATKAVVKVHAQLQPSVWSEARFQSTPSHSPWYNHHGWLGIKNKFLSFSTITYVLQPIISSPDTTQHKTSVPSHRPHWKLTSESTLCISTEASTLSVLTESLVSAPKEAESTDRTVTDRTVTDRTSLFCLSSSANMASLSLEMYPMTTSMARSRSSFSATSLSVPPRRLWRSIPSFSSWWRNSSICITRRRQNSRGGDMSGRSLWMTLRNRSSAGRSWLTVERWAFKDQGMAWPWPRELDPSLAALPENTGKRAVTQCLFKERKSKMTAT